MTSEETQRPTVISLIGASIGAITKNTAILVPFCWVAFIQLLSLELIYFIPRPPLVKFFGPVVSKLWGSVYLHYPANFQLIPRLFQYVQIPLFIFVSSFCAAAAIYIVEKVNNDEKVDVGAAFRFALSKYAYILVAALLSFGLVFLFSNMYDLVVQRALEIQSTSGKFFIIKKIVLDGAPFVNLFLSVCATTVFIFMIPLIIVGKQKIIAAFANNFKLLFKVLPVTFGVVFLPSLVYVPILVLRNIFTANQSFPAITLTLLVLSIIVIVFIDAVVNTAITLLYLMKREDL